VWKVPAGGGEAVQVTRDGGSGAAFESADGKYLYYVRRSHIWKAPLDGGPGTQIIAEPLSYGCNYLVMEDGLYFIASTGYFMPAALTFFDFATGRLTPITKIDRWFLGLAVSPDRRSILYTEIKDTGGSLMLVENFR
jgi:hypothetical protein